MFFDFKIVAWLLIISKNIWKDMFRNKCTLNTGISRNKVSDSDIFVGQKIKIKPRVSQFSL